MCVVSRGACPTVDTTSRIPNTMTERDAAMRGTTSAKNTSVHAAMFVRRKRSLHSAMGTPIRICEALVRPTTNPSPASERWNDFWMSGASTFDTPLSITSVTSAASVNRPTPA